MQDTPDARTVLTLDEADEADEAAAAVAAIAANRGSPRARRHQFRQAGLRRVRPPVRPGHGAVSQEPVSRESQLTRAGTGA
jgi:hypothetical protein